MQNQLLKMKAESNFMKRFLSQVQKSVSTIFLQELTFLSYTPIRTTRKFTVSFPAKEKSSLMEKKLLSLPVIG